MSIDTVTYDATLHRGAWTRLDARVFAPCGLGFDSPLAFTPMGHRDNFCRKKAPSLLPNIIHLKQNLQSVGPFAQVLDMFGHVLPKIPILQKLSWPPGCNFEPA